MTIVLDALRPLTLLLGLFCAMSGIGMFMAGITPGRSAPWWKQYGASALFLAASYYLLTYALP